MGKKNRAFCALNSLKIGLLTTGLLLAEGTIAADNPSTGTRSTPAENACDSMLASWVDASAPVGVNYSIQEYKLSELYELAQKHPDMLLNAAQRYARVILAQKWENGLPYKEVLEPTYRARKIKLWKAFSGLPEIKNRMIVDQYKAVDEIVQWILSLARGQTANLAKLIVGPPGTGKTEILYILDLLDAHMATNSPSFFKIAFRWKPSLREIPELRNAILVQKGTTGNPDDDHLIMVNPGLENAPILGLFPPGMQDKLAKAGDSQIVKEIDAHPNPKAFLDGINQFILDAVVRHEMRERKIVDSSALTQQTYLEILGKYLVAYKYVPTVDKDSRILRYPGETPNMGAIFLDEHLLMAQFYPNTAMAWKPGQVPRASGGGLFIDELRRYSEEFQNIALELFQNNVASYGAAPAFRGDWVIIASSNDESVEKSTKNSLTGANASNDRTDAISMRQPIHPLNAAKIAMILVGSKNFWMRDLTKDDAQWVPADINQIYTHPDERGNITGPEGRFALKYSPQGPDHVTAITIAPRALTYMGLIAAATRIVIDAKRLEAHKNEFSKATFESQFVLDPEKRMQIILGDLSVDGPIAKELDRMRDIFREGTEGVTARNTLAWMTAAFQMAAQRFESEPTLTPNVVLRSFLASLDDVKFKPVGSQSKMDWMLLAREMTHTFLQGWLTQDLRMIQSGDPTRVQKVYEDVARDIQTLSDNDWSAEGENPTGDHIKIDWDRYFKIRQIYREQNFGRELVPAKVSIEHLKAKGTVGMWETLRKAVEVFVMTNELQMASTAALEDYFSGRENLPPQTLELGQRAEVIMGKFGYNRPAVRDALAMVKDITRQNTGNRPRP